MTHFPPLAALGLVAALALPSLALAQTDPLVLPDRAEVEPGEAFVSAIHRDWQVRCIRSTADEIPDRCEMFQLLEEENGNPVAEFRIAGVLEEADGVVASATILTPLDTLLSPGIQLQVDENPPAQVPFAFCRPIGCFVQLTLTADDIAMFENGADAQVVLFALIRDEQGQMGGAPVRLLASLRGFTAAYDDVTARMVDIRAFIAEQEAAAPAEAPADGAVPAEGEAPASE